MEHYPLNIFVEYDIRSSDQFCELARSDALGLKTFEIDSSVFQETQGILGYYVIPLIKVKVELPSANSRGDETLFIRYGNPDLNDFGADDIFSDKSVLHFGFV